ncbi:MAG: hypothetical protein J6V90_04315 [Treponema sp.]|nr:hypothetical protein [Treponema sp.]
MMKIKMIPADKLIQLKESISSMTKSYDNPNNNWISEYLGNEVFIDTRFTCPDVELTISDNENDDFDNVVKLYGSLKDVLSDSVATEERLWTGFTLDRYYEYSAKRWKQDSRWTANGIRDHLFFMNTGRRALTRNAVSRLWWIGRLTYDNELNSPDPWKYTRYVCTHQRFIVDFLERNISNSFSLLKPTIDAVLKWEANHENREVDSNKMREIQKYINILGGIYILDCLEYQFLYDKVYSKIETLMEN